MFIVDNQQMKLVGKVTPILQQQERPIGIRSELIYSVGVRVWFYFKMIFFAQCFVLFWRGNINEHIKTAFYFKMIFFALNLFISFLFWIEILTNILKIRFISRRYFSL